MSVTRTSLIHPTMINKIRKGMHYAQKGQGHMMNGHGKRVYIQNAKGHNIMRLDWIGGREGYIVYGNESRNVTRMVRNALHSVIARDLLDPLPQVPSQKAKDLVANNSHLRERLTTLAKLAGISTLGVLMTGCTMVGNMF
jgi:hypothetical protein